MISLSEIMDRAKMYGWTDLECIFQYFALNDSEEQGVEIISKLSTEKIKKLRYKNDTYKANSQMINMSLASLIDQYKEHSAFLIELIMADMFENESMFNQMLGKARELIPTLKKPTIFWRDTYDKLYKMGIKFKGVE